MVTSAPSLNSVDDVISIIPDNDIKFYDSIDPEEIRNGHICDCDTPSLESHLWEGDKTAVAVCSCEGYYSKVLYNW